MTPVAGRQAVTTLRSRGAGAGETVAGDAHPRLVYRPELDALRGMAVLLVIGGHLYVPGLLGGGNVGVTLFFVLSGYLITSILRENGDLRRFYGRRIRRLVPALVVWLAVLVVAGVVTLGEALHPLLYVANWSAATGNLAGPLGHTWSLAVEEQFYLVWPVVMLVFVRRPVALLVAVIVVTTTASLLAPTNALFLEVGRFGAIAWGCLLGLGIVPKLPRLVVAVAIGVLAYVVLLPPADPAWANRVGPAIAASAFAVMSMLVRRDTGPLAIRPLMAVGRISYGLYLWHYPFALALWPRLFDGADRPGDLVWTLAAVAATFGCAVASWFIVERRFLRSHLRDDRRPAADPVERHVVVHVSPDAECRDRHDG